MLTSPESILISEAEIADRGAMSLALGLAKLLSLQQIDLSGD